MGERDAAAWRQEYYEQEAPELLEGARRARRSVDKLVRWLAGGALALSVGFFHQIENPSPESVVLLKAGWILLVVSLLSVFASFHSMEAAYNRQRQLVERVRDGEIDRPADHPNRWDEWTERFNWIATPTALLGTLAVILFAWFNL